jgi:AcrR family transcriptional regulator
MVRWQPDAHGRLQQAALELYGEKGFDETTVAEIAEQAGLTKRTFFRYFADKREVLFARSEEVEELFVTEVEKAPKSAAPLDAVAVALDAVADRFEPGRDHSSRRQRIIDETPDLQERELIKLASLSAAVAGALHKRGVKGPAAILTAEAGMAVFKVAFDRWVATGNKRTFKSLMHESLNELRAVTAA